ncbi:hypothetical protein SK128_004442 [Halocaridina rubra]|uniref:Uncharacterized protein n=1 Tax=Halocaridina rubra TaxID=373956 RepID=A0AAN8WNG1_HALRR
MLYYSCKKYSTHSTNFHSFHISARYTTTPSVNHTTEVTRDHKWITREAIRRNIRQFFLDFPPPSQPNFNVPTTASLTELYHAYYGEAASPARFIRAVNTIAGANVKADSSPNLR